MEFETTGNIGTHDQQIETNDDSQLDDNISHDDQYMEVDSDNVSQSDHQSEYGSNSENSSFRKLQICNYIPKRIQ